MCFDSLVSFACVSKGCVVVSVAFFEVCCKSTYDSVEASLVTVAW